MDVSAARADVAGALATALGMRCHTTAPEQPRPPFAYLAEPPTDFVTPAEGQPYGTWAITFAVDVIIAPTGSNNGIIGRADDAATALVTLDGPDYSVSVDGYTTVTHAGQAYLSVPATITAHRTR